MALELWAQEERHQVQMAAMRRQMQRALQAAARCLGQNAAASGSSLSRAAGAANAKLRDRADLSRQRSKELSSQFNAALARAGLREADGAAEQDGGDSSDSDSGGVVLADLDALLKSKAPHGSDKMTRESRASSSVDERAEQPDGSAHGSAWGSEPPSPMPPAAGQGSASQAQGLAQGGSSGGPESGRPAAQAPTSARGAGKEGAAVPAAGAAAPASQPSGGFFSSFFGRGGGSDLQNV